MTLMTLDEAEEHSRRRRTWTNEEKWQIVQETELPGVAVAEVARRYCVNNNQLFGWIRAAEAGKLGPRPIDLEPLPIIEGQNEFIPIGVFARCDEEGAALLAPLPTVRPSDPSNLETPQQAVSEVPQQSRWSGLPAKGPALDERAGVIEVDLPSGVRLRVDAFVSKQALKRVLSALDETP